MARKKQFNKNFKKQSNKRKHFRSSDSAVNSRPSGPFCSIKEDQVGITEYVQAGPGFTGIIKARFSDFQVNEIDVKGNEVKLTDQKVPVVEEDCKEVLSKSKAELASIITEETWKKIEELLKDEKADKKQSIDINVSNLEKDKRTLIHKTLKGEFGGALVSTTATIGEEKFIQCFRAKGNSGTQRNKWLWPDEYVYFVVHKENADTVQAASDLANFLRLRPSEVNYAGTKDKRAKTSQLFCVKKRDPIVISRAAKGLRYMKIGNFAFKENVLKLGNLKGNRFRIGIRQIDGDEGHIADSLQHIKENGFINYFGLQRFGNSAGVPTFEVGIALLKSEYKEACELILKPRDGEQHFMKEIREFWWKHRDSAKAASMFCSDKFVEKKLLDGLAQYGEKDYANSLRKIPRNVLLLYTHSYQSLLWNRIASRRIRDFGLKLIPGDLVYKERVNPEDVTINTLEGADAECEEDPSSDIEEQIGKPTESPHKNMVKPLTEEDIANNKYTIFDIVLPLAGYDITYPSNEMAMWYEEALSENGLTSERLKHNVKTYSLAGAYRKLLTKPENMSWRFQRYNSPTSTLIASDIEDLENKKSDVDIPDGIYKALILDFTLPASSYATMALRELMKCDTSVSGQQKLTEELKMREEADAKEKDRNEIQVKVVPATDIDDKIVGEGEGEIGKRKSDETIPSECKRSKVE